MSIFPLPVFEADADDHHRLSSDDIDVYERLEAPKTIVVRYGQMSLIGEFPYGGDAKPGCGSKLVARTPRGTELCEMLTTSCTNAGCAKSVSRKEVLKYIDNSGGRDFPWATRGRILRIATIDDLNAHSALSAKKPEWIRICKGLIISHELDMKLVDVEPILGEEVLTFYFMSEDRVDFRELVRELAAACGTRIEMRQVGARDEARLVADYERCGQHCCCKNFLKVLRPVSMKSAKLQKTTLDPMKISGRCGRLMCCLRYEDATYAELRKNLPHRKSRVGTMEGPGIVMDTKILVQLALVKLEHDDREIAVPIEELMDPETCPRPGEHAAKLAREAASEAASGLSTDEVNKRIGDPDKDDERKGKRRRRRRRKGGEGKDGEGKSGESKTGEGKTGEGKSRGGGRNKGGGGRGKKSAPPASGDGGSTSDRPAGGRDGAKSDGDTGGGDGKRRRRRRRRRRPPEQES